MYGSDGPQRQYRSAPEEDALAARLLAEHGDRAERRGSPLWFEIEAGNGPGTGTGRVVECCAVDGLLGRRVDRRFWAVATVGTGRLRLLDEAHEPAACLRRGLAGGLRMACVVSRAGRTGWRMTLPDGDRFDRAPEEGMMLDTLRRSLELPTAPPPAGTACLQMSMWLSAVLSDPRQKRGRRGIGWAELLSFHPAFPDGPPPTEDEATDLMMAMAGCAWEDLRTMVARGRGSGYFPPPALAGWMDAGMFSRWVLGGLPPTADLVRRAGLTLEPGARRWLNHLYRALLADRPDGSS